MTDFRWFIYGSSLDRAAFADWAAQHGYQPPDLWNATPGRIDGFRLIFDVQSRFWGGAVADVIEAPGAHVEGLIATVPSTLRPMIEHKEGAATGLYVPFTTVAFPTGGGLPVEVVAFRGAVGRASARDEAPSPSFLASLVRGARASGLSALWIEKLEALRTP